MANDVSIVMNQADLKRFQKACLQIPEKVFKRTVGKAANKSMTPVVRTAKKLAPKESGDYRKSIGKKQKKYTRSKVVWTGVGAIKGKPNAYLAHLLEFGHRIVVGGTTARISGPRAGRIDRADREGQTGKGRVVGFVPAQPHLRSALARNSGKVIGTYTHELRNGIIQASRSV